MTLTYPSHDSRSGNPDNNRRLRLIWRIHQHYATITDNLLLGASKLSFTRIADPNRVLDQVADEEDRREKKSGQRLDGDQLHLPYWAELWDSALGLSQLLLRRGLLAVHSSGQSPDTLKTATCGAHDGRLSEATMSAEAAARELSKSSAPQKPELPAPGASAKVVTPGVGLSVLDLGCGMGLIGTVAARLGARVLFADLEPAALLFAQLNSLADSQRVRTRQLNWRTARLAERFDLILGADIIYERAQWEFLEPFWRAHLAGGGSVLLGEPGRQTGDLFVDWIVARGWGLTIVEEPVTTRARPIRLFQLHTKSMSAD